MTGTGSCQADALSQYELANQEQLKENYYKAIELYKESLALNPSFVKPMIGLAQCFKHLGQNEEALNYITMARRYDRNNLDLVNFEAGIRTVMGELDTARQLFESVVKEEPHNLEARFGLAELDLADGRKRNAAQQYLETLKASPNNVRALLSLAALYGELGEDEASSAYLERALRYYANNPNVYFAAGRHYLKKFDFLRAAEYLEAAIILKPDFEEAKQMLGSVYLKQDKNGEAIELFRENLASRNPDIVHQARYALGIAYGIGEEVEGALESFQAVIRLRPDDEVARLAAENLALRHPEETEMHRRNFSRYHLEEGRDFESRNHLKKALTEYRRAVRLDPDSSEARLAYGGIYRRLGFSVKYLMELILLRDYYDYNEQSILDNIEIYENTLDTKVSARWADRIKPMRNTAEFFDQFSVAKNTYSIILSTLESENELVHCEADSQFMIYLEDLILWYDKFELLKESLRSASFESLFRQAREAEADFFLIFQYTETERSFKTDCRIYLSRSGSLLREFSVYRTGNNRIRECLASLVEQVASAFPLKGTILAREFDSGVINLGTFHNVGIDDVFLILKKDRVRYNSDQIGFSYNPEDLLGEFTVTQVDENISEGTIDPTGFFDRINTGDEVILLPPEENTD